MAVLGPKVWIAGILIAVAAAVVFLGPIILVLGGPELYHRFKNRHSEESRDYYLVPTRTKLVVGAVYLSLTALLIVGIVETYVPAPSSQKHGAGPPFCASERGSGTELVGAGGSSHIRSPSGRSSGRLRVVRLR